MFDNYYDTCNVATMQDMVSRSMLKHFCNLLPVKQSAYNYRYLNIQVLQNHPFPPPLPLPHSSSELEIGYEFPEYTVDETAGSVEVCVVVTRGTTGTTKMVTFDLEEASATGRY